MGKSSCFIPCPGFCHVSLITQLWSKGIERIKWAFLGVVSSLEMGWWRPIYKDWKQKGGDFSKVELGFRRRRRACCVLRSKTRVLYMCALTHQCLRCVHLHTSPCGFSSVKGGSAELKNQYVQANYFLLLMAFYRTLSHLTPCNYCSEGISISVQLCPY